MRRKNKSALYIVFVALALLLIFFAFGFYKHYQNKTPDKEIASTQLSMAKAKNNQANIFAPTKFIEAELKYHEAMEEWKIQNDKFLFWRNYKQVHLLAKESNKLFTEAIKLADSEKKEANVQLALLLESLKEKLFSFEKNYRSLPLELIAFEQYSLAKIKYHEAFILYGQKKIYEAEKLANESNEFIRKASYKGKSQLETFYKDYPQWQKNKEWAIAASSKGKTVILISKIEKSCKVIRSGKTIAEFDAEFGKNWLGDKKKRGDKATPEGIYKVIRKNDVKKTKFFKSLLLDYPNDGDKVKFADMIKNGEIAKNSNIGNLIEIHGDGGKGVNWTDGCIALENKEMERLFDLCKINTPVVIIGAETSLAAFLK